MLRFALDNGMRAVVDASGPSDVAAVYVWINVGSADEPEGLWGAAHFVEHMVFKGTNSYGVGEVAAAIEDLGGDLNAWTSFDETVFHATVPAPAAEAAMSVLAEMLRTARFDAAELGRERTVILEEIRGSVDDPDSVLGEASYATAWPGHSYGRPVIGTVSSVRSMSPEALRGFYAHHYQPANACLAVAGPVDASAVRAAAERMFSGGGSAPPRVRRRPVDGVRRPRTLRRGFEAVLVDLAYPGPGIGDPSVASLDVLCSALGGGAASPLEARLRLREGLCHSADAGYQAEIDAGMAVVTLHAREGRGTEAVTAAREEIARARLGALGELEVERAKAQILAERIFGRETVDGRADSLVWHTERLGDPEGWRRYDAEIEAVQVADVAEAARRWLDPSREVAVALVPDGEQVSLARSRRVTRVAPPREELGSKTGAASTHARSVAAAPTRLVLGNGVRILLHPDAGEVAAIRIAGLGGALAERASTAGRGSAWARCLVRGAGERDAVGFAAAVEGIAGSIGAGSGRSSQAIRAEFISARLDEGLALTLDVLGRPRFARGEVARVRDELREALAQREDHPDHLLAERVWGAAYGTHPYGLPFLGEPSTLRGLRGPALLEHHLGWAVGPNLVVAVAGAFDPERVLAQLVPALEGLPAGPAFTLPEPPSLTPDEREVSLNCGREQAHLAWAFPGVAVSDPRQPAVELLAAVLGGQGGRLFVELREEHGLAYSVGAASQEGVQQGLLVCSVATDPERVAEAEARLGTCLAQLAAGGITNEEIERARRYILGATEHDLQTASARANLAAYSDLYGQDGLRYRADVQARIQAVTADDVRRMAAECLTRPVVRGRLLPKGRR